MGSYSGVVLRASCSGRGGPDRNGTVNFLLSAASGGKAARDSLSRPYPLPPCLARPGGGGGANARQKGARGPAGLWRLPGEAALPGRV